MRDIVIVVMGFGAIPYIIFRPWIGVMFWVMYSIMAPHRLTWNFGSNLPYVQVIAITTAIAILVANERKPLPNNVTVKLFIAFTVWVCFTTIFALSYEYAVPRMIFVLKVLAIGYFILLTIHTREQLHALVWVLVISIMYYGSKGGMFMIMTGGNYMVLGPPGSPLASNNGLALAMLTSLPLARYLQLNTENKYLRWLLGFGMLFSLLSILSSFSRGGVLALVAMSTVLVAKSRNRALIGGIVFCVAITGLLLMPDHWYARMYSTLEYQDDPSAQGRLDVWKFAWELAKARPIVGGGFDVFYYDRAYMIYTPGINGRSAHSIIFQVLGEHGFVGLFLFLMLGITSWFKGNWVIRATADRPDLRWASDLASMIQTGLVGYFVGGLFLNQAFFDLIYVMMTLMIIAATIVTQELEATTEREALLQAEPGPEMGPLQQPRL